MTKRNLRLLVLLALPAPIAHAEAPPEVVGIDKSGEFRSGGKFRNAQMPKHGNADIQKVRHHKHAAFERLVLDFHTWEGYDKMMKGTAALDTPSAYTISYEEAPCRFYIEYAGRGGSALYRLPDFSKSELVRRIDRIPLYDDATYGFAIVTKQPVEFEIFELHNPARVVVDIRPAASAEKTVYSVRSHSVESGPEFEELVEIARSEFPDAEPRRLFSEDGKHPCVELGQSYRKWKAELILADLVERHGGRFFIESRTLSADPATVFLPY